MSCRRSALLPLLALLAATLCLAAPAAAVSQRDGRSPGGAWYRIAVPDGWRPGDPLVLWNHGFSLSEPGPGPDLGPLADRQLAEGYAVAATSFRMGGWALFASLDDLRELVTAFTDAFGAPGPVIVTGGSMGGLVTAQAVEGGGLGDVVGAYPICGVLGGSQVWDEALDLRLAYDAVCADVAGARIPGGASGYRWPSSDVDQVLVGLAVQACTGALLPPSQRSAGQKRRLAQLVAVTGIPEAMIPTDLAFAVFGLADLVHDPRKLGDAAALPNLGVVYPDPDVDAAIARVTATPAGRARLLSAYTPTGEVGDTRVLGLHGDLDGLVFVEHLGEYAARVPPDRLTAVVARGSEPAHCDFTAAEVVAGWESLRSWLASDRQPRAADVAARCQALVASGEAQGPCRLDPSFALPRLSARQALRGTLAPCDAGAGELCLGDAGRFRVTTRWRTTRGEQGTGHGVPLTADTGWFWFFSPSNVELVTKVLDGCGLNDRRWVFAGGLTDVAVDLEVEDTATGLLRAWHSPAGMPYAPLQDTAALATCH